MKPLRAVPFILALRLFAKTKNKIRGAFFRSLSRLESQLFLFHLPTSSSSSMDTLQWPEGIRNVNSTVEDNSAPTNEEQVTANSKALGTRPQQAKPKALNCPRCNSTHTKFCYYNNYSLSQPRYFCKTCRRYWTAGGSLRNVPVGGGPRKQKRYSSSLSKIKLLPQTSINSQNPNYIQDLNLAFSPFCPSNINSSTIFNQFVEFPSTTTSSNHHNHISELSKSGICGKGFNSFMSMINPISDSNNSGLAFQEFGKPDRLHFRPDQNNNSDEAKLFFPFEDLKQAAEPQLINSSMSRNDHELVDQHSRLNEPDHHQTAAGYRDGLAGSSGGGSWYLNMHEEN